MRSRSIQFIYLVFVTKPIFWLGHILTLIILVYHLALGQWFSIFSVYHVVSYEITNRYFNQTFSVVRWMMVFYVVMITASFSDYTHRKSLVYIVRQRSDLIKNAIDIDILNFVLIVLFYIKILMIHCLLNIIIYGTDFFSLQYEYYLYLFLLVFYLFIFTKFVAYLLRNHLLSLIVLILYWIFEVLRNDLMRANIAIYQKIIYFIPLVSLSENHLENAFHYAFLSILFYFFVLSSTFKSEY